MDFALSKRPGRQFTADALFTSPEITGGGPSQAGNAAQIVSLGKSFGANRRSAPRFDRLAATSIAARADQRIAAETAEAGVLASGISTYGQTVAAKAISEAQKSAAKAQAQGAGIGSALGAVGQIGGALLAFSDESTKHSIDKIEDALATLRALRPVTFYYTENYSSDPERMHHGFIAQEFQKVVPDATYRDKFTDKLCIDTNDLIALLVRAIQQLEGRVTRLEAQRVLERSM